MRNSHFLYGCFTIKSSSNCAEERDVKIIGNRSLKSVGSQCVFFSVNKAESFSLVVKSVWQFSNIVCYCELLFRSGQYITSKYFFFLTRIIFKIKFFICVNRNVKREYELHLNYFVIDRTD